MADDITDIRDYYNNPDTGEGSRLDRHQLERDVTRRYFQEFLPPQARVLEIGAAAGGYTVWLAERGHHVVAVDLSEYLVEQCKKRVAEAGLASSVEYRVADARDLTSVRETHFDAVLLMGPLYHLILREDRIKALREALSKLRPGGLFVSALISRFGIMGHLLRHVPQWVENQAEVRFVLEHGYDPEHTPDGGFRGYFVTVDEVAPLHEEAGLETLVVAGVEPAISADDESYNRLTGVQRELWLDLLYELSREPSLVASSRHLLYVGRKAEG
jgi:S-adenosylmethionine-dependent methyltransferase